MEGETRLKHTAKYVLRKGRNGQHIKVAVTIVANHDLDYHTRSVLESAMPTCLNLPEYTYIGKLAQRPPCTRY